MLASLECARGIRWKRSVACWVHSSRIAANCLKLKRQLDGGTYRLGGYTVFDVTEPKRRQIKAPKLRDRIVQRAMCNNGLYDDLTRGNIRDNSACQLGKGTSFAARRLKCRLQRHMRKYGTTGWVLKLDISRFFDSIPHAGLHDMVDRLVRNAEFRRLVHDVIDSFPDPGIGLGSQLSQLLAIAYLSPVDHYVKESLRLPCYERYSDDMVMAHPCRGRLAEAMAGIRSRLDALGLTLNPKSSLHPLSHGVKFLKFRFLPVCGGRVPLLPSRAGTRRILRRLSRLVSKARAGARSVSDAWTCFMSWRAHAMEGDSWRAIQSVRSRLTRMLAG